MNRAQYAQKMQELFPHAKIPQVDEIPEVFPEMVYHLCKIVADQQVNQCNFDELKSKVEEFFRFSLIQK